MQMSLFAASAGVLLPDGSKLPNEVKAVQQKKRQIKGVVVDSKGETIIGAAVQVKGTTRGVQTGLDGDFAIDGVSPGEILVVKSLGYKTQEVTVPQSGTLRIVLEEDAKALEEVVVVGYGTQKKVNLTGAVSSVDAKTLEARPVQNVSQALQGVVPGLNLNVGNGGGALNSTMSMNIRGAGTVGDGSSSAPLILIDGTPGDINSLSPSDIQSISVLKDASSSAIYGSRAAFGVILVTTKSGKSGRVNVTYNGSLRFNTATQLPNMMNSLDFARYFNEAAANAAQTPVFSDDAIAKIQKYMQDPNADDVKYGTYWSPDKKEWVLYGEAWANTNWFKEFYKSNVPSHEHNIAISGGTDKVTYYISGAVLDQNGLIRHGKDALQRYNFSGKITAKLTDWLKIGYNNTWIREDFTKPRYLTGLFFHNIARRWPVNPVKDPNGHYVAGVEILQLRDGGIYKSQTDRLRQQFTLELTPLEGLMLRAELNYNVTDGRVHQDKRKIYIYQPDGKSRLLTGQEGGDAGQTATEGSSYRTNYYNGRFYSEYSKTIDKHYLKGVVGLDMEYQHYNNIGAYNRDNISDKLTDLSLTQYDKPTVSGGNNHWATMGLFARVNYVYDERYLFEASLRRDGSSRFIGDKTWGTFPAFSLGWNISNEAFFAPAKDLVNQLKLRASWGQLGNTNITALYPWFLGINVRGAASNWLFDGARVNIAGLPGLVNEALTWERVTSWNLGLDFGLFNNRLSGSFDYFIRNTYDMVGPPVQVPSVIGVTLPKVNNADLKSYGWELELKWRDRLGDLGYGAKLVLSDDKQKITKFNNEKMSLSNWYIGRINGEIWGYEAVGIAKSQAEMDEHLKKNKPDFGSGWGAGDIMYKDLSGDGKVNSGGYTLNDHGDLKIIGNNTPRLRFGITLDANWKGFDFSVFLQGVAKRDFWDSSPYRRGANGNKWQAAAFEEHKDYFRPKDHPLGANLDASLPRPILDNSYSKNWQVNTMLLMNAAYLRVKNIQLGYTLPEHLVSRVGLKRARFYVSADNIATLTKLPKIFDPEGLGGDYDTGKLYPLQRSIAVGLNLNF